MRYIDVKWLHQNQEDPIRLVSEIDSNDYETRKLEFFEDGRAGFACASGSQLGVVLGTVSVPSLAEINATGEFEGTEICAADFDALWAAVVR